MRRRIDQLEMDLADSKDENEQLNQRLSTTLSRINILKTTNQVRIFLIFNFHLFIFLLFYIETSK
jgi:hypothetical protein